MAKKSLWDFYGGEPFMENPHLAIIGNSPQKGSSMSYHKKRTRKRRKNPFPTAGLAINRPKKRHAKRRSTSVVRYVKSSPKKYHKKRARKNPAVLGVALPPVNMIAWGAGGFIAPPMVEGFVNKFLPVEVTGNTLGRYAIKIGSVLGLTWLTKYILVVGSPENHPP